MEFDNAFEVPLPPAQAWPVLMDIRGIAPCMPGAKLTEVIDDKNYKGNISVRLGPVALTFAGGTPDVSPITPYIANLQGGYGVYTHLVTAAAFVAIVVPIAVFFLLQRYFVRGLVAGAVEG